MNVIDAVRFLDRDTPERPGRRQRPVDKRVEQAQSEAQTTDAFLNHLREMLTGPYQRVSEARFDEMLDILSEQEQKSQSKLSALEAGLEDVVAETGFLRQKYDGLHERLELLLEQTEHERQAMRAAFEEELGKLRVEFETKSLILADTLQKSLKDNAAETRRALEGLAHSVEDSKQESTRLFEQAKASSHQSLEARIAQWRAEIEDERKEDMGEVAAAMMEIGKRMMALRKPAA